MMKQRYRLTGSHPGKSLISLFLVLLVYSFIVIISINRCYFWDNVQFTSKEAHWYYNNNFSSLLLPGFSEGAEIVGTGCHPPFMGFVTAMLWKIFGKHLWVSHVFIALWAVVLIWNTWKLLKIVLPEVVGYFALPVILLDSTILSQIYIASPDVVLLAAFVTALRAMVEKRKILLTIVLIFLVLISGRGAATSGILLIFYLIHQRVSENKIITPRLIINSIVTFLPAFILAGAYYVYYISTYGWFFSNPDSPWAESGARPESWAQILKNTGAFCLRLSENGRIIIYILVIISLLIIFKKKVAGTFFKGLNLSLVLLFTFLYFFFLYFVLTTTSVITSRYYMGMFFVLCIILFRMLPEIFPAGRIKIVSVLIIVFLLTGNFWTYPDKISKAWDATLAHVPYYELRSDCLNYLEVNGIDFTKVSGGFCFSGNQKYVDLEDRDLLISDRTDTEYFIYSNISNLDDALIDELMESGKWTKVKSFKKGAVSVTIYRNGS